jgi:hypothetical protein
MTSETFRSVALDILGNYRRAARSAADTFRGGNARGFARLNEGVGAVISDCEGLLTGRIKRSVNDAQERLTDVLDRMASGVGRLGDDVKATLGGTEHRVLTTANKADRMVDKLLSGASRKLAKRPAKNTRLAKLLQSNLVASVESLGIRGAMLVRRASAAVAEGTENLSTRVAGSGSTAVARKKLKRPRRRSVRSGS